MSAKETTFTCNSLEKKKELYAMSLQREQDEGEDESEI
jgi:hypothetical protein